MSLATLKTKVEMLIEKAQSGGGIGYPEWGFTRPAWWLERPKVTVTEGVNEVYYLIELDADKTEYNGLNVSDLEILPNGKKQIWIRTSLQIDNSRADGYYVIPVNAEAIEIIVNCESTNVTLAYRSDIMPTLSGFTVGFTNLQIITGTPISIGTHMQDGFGSKYLKVVDCDVRTEANYEKRNFMFAYSSLVNAVKLKAEYYGGAMYRDCRCLRDAGELGFSFIEDCFYNCTSLEKAHIKADCRGFTTTTFYGCSKLKDITVESGFSATIYLQHSTEYTRGTLHAIIENLADMTGETAPTFQIGNTNIKKIDEEHIAMLEAKNWNYL